MKIQSLTGAWQFCQADTEEWLPASVPGGVHTDLLALGRIPDPFVGDNERRVQWVAERDWEYRCTFEVAPRLLDEERVFLVCDGLDTLADVTLNGQPVGHAENAFRHYLGRSPSSWLRARTSCACSSRRRWPTSAPG